MQDASGFLWQERPVVCRAFGRVRHGDDMNICIDEGNVRPRQDIYNIESLF